MAAFRKLRRQLSEPSIQVKKTEALMEQIIKGDISSLRSKDINSHLSFMHETPLHHVVGRGLDKVALELIKKKADVNAALIVGDTPLHWASARGHIGCADVLLRNGADIDKRNSNNWTPLHDAVNNCKRDVVAFLLSRNADPTATTDDLNTALHWAAARGDTEITQCLLNSSVSINVTNAVGSTALHLCAQKGNVEVVSLLLTSKADPTIKNMNGLTALDFATDAATQAILLGRRHRNPDVKDNGWSPIHHAAAGGNIAAIKSLLLSSSLDEPTADDQNTPLHLAADNGHTDTVAFLLSKKALLAPRNKSGDTPLHVACSRGHVATAALLVTNPVSLDAQNLKHESPVFVAVASNRIGALALLLESKASPSIPDAQSQSPLHLAVRNGRMDATVLLLDAKCSPNVVDENDVSPLHIAAEIGNSAITRYLLFSGALTSAKDKNGRSPADAASSVELSILLAESHHSPHSPPSDYTGTPIYPFSMSTSTIEGLSLHWAAAQGHTEVASQLLDKGMSANQQSETGDTALHWAALRGRTPMISHLVQRGANLQIKNNCGLSALHEAAKKNFVATVQVLIRLEADVNASDNNGDTVLHAAAAALHLRTVQTLIQHKAAVNAENLSGKTPLHLAAMCEGEGDQQQLAVMRALTEAGGDQSIADFTGRIPSEYIQAASVKSNFTLISKGITIPPPSPRPSPSPKLFSTPNRSPNSPPQSKSVSPASPLIQPSKPTLSIHNAFAGLHSPSQSPLPRETPHVKLGDLKFPPPVIIPSNALSTSLVAEPRLSSFSNLTPKRVFELDLTDGFEYKRKGPSPRASLTRLRRGHSSPALVSSGRNTFGSRLSGLSGSAGSNHDSNLSTGQEVVRFLKNLVDSGILDMEQNFEVRHLIAQLASTRNIWISSRIEQEDIEDDLCREMVTDALYNPAERSTSSSTSRSGSILSFGVRWNNVSTEGFFPSPAPPSVLPEIAACHSWRNWDAFKADSVTEGHCLSELVIYLFQWYGFHASLNINNVVAQRAMNILESKYQKSNPYHNHFHAADVVQGVHYLLSAGGFMKLFTPLECLALIFAAAIHDVDHPGTTNAFEAATFSDLDLRYNDRSVLENHHVSTAFKILWGVKRKKGCPPREDIDLFAPLSLEDRRQVRSLIIELVLGTDMGYSMELINRFKTDCEAGGLSDVRESLASGAPLDVELEPHEKLLLMKMMLKCADISHTARPLPYHLLWVENVTNEFYNQGDRERALNITPLSFMDRTLNTEKAFFCKGQAGFMRFVALPMWTPMGSILPTAAQEVLLCHLQNIEHWESSSRLASVTDDVVLE